MQFAISALKPTPSSLVVDVFETLALEVAEEFHTLKYVLVTSVWPLALILGNKLFNMML
jgi:hypothetical protein